jgi:hypothetical protein
MYKFIIFKIYILMSHYNTHNPHPLIPRDPTYSVNRKLITFHTEDRDIVHWPHANEFEIKLPESLTNVESMRLVEIVLPVNYYNISRELQNTSMQITVSGTAHIITLEEGFYTPAQIANALTNKIHTAVGGVEFQVHYNDVSQKLWFSSSDNLLTPIPFSIDANVNVVGDHCAGGVPASYCPEKCDYIQDGSQFAHYTKWGLPFNLGFFRKEYKATTNDTGAPITFGYVTAPSSAPLSPLPPIIVPIGNYYIEASFPVSLFGHSVVYMEVDKYNSMDELTPYPQRTNDLYDNDYNGRVNSAFAKIPITATPQAQVFESKNGFLQNASNHFNPPLERLQKLKFRFRYHDGRLVNFKQENFNFSIAFNELRNEQLKNRIVRVPDTYLMT